jgi:hypothetical protein
MNSAMKRHLCAGILLASVSGAGCASTPRVVVPPVSFEQKIGWILELEDRRVLSLPDPPPPAPPPGRRRAQPTVPSTPIRDLARLVMDPDARIRRRAAIAVGRVGLREGLARLTPLLADADPEVRIPPRARRSSRC